MSTISAKETIFALAFFIILKYTSSSDTNHGESSLIFEFSAHGIQFKPCLGIRLYCSTSSFHKCATLSTVLYSNFSTLVVPTVRIELYIVLSLNNWTAPKSSSLTILSLIISRSFSADSVCRNLFGTI